MSVRRLLVPVRGDGKGEGVLDHALILAKKYKAHVQVLNTRPRPEDVMPFGVVVPSIVKKQITSAAQDASSAEQARLKDLFDAYAKDHKVSVIDELPAPSGKVTMSWHQETGKQAQWIGRHGRLADMILVPKPDREQNLGANTLQAALMNTGRPVMVCPGEAPDDLCAHIAFAWNGSREASRAAGLLMPVFKLARRITVLSVDTGNSDIAIPAEEFVDFLHEHKLEAELNTLKADANKVAVTLMKGAQNAGADCLASGAYGQSRGRELVFGGVTQNLINHASFPVILAH